MIDISLTLEGFEEFNNLLEKLKNEDLSNIKAVVYSDSQIIQVFEYGSIPEVYPWKGTGPDTAVVADILTGATRIASIHGFAMLRSNEEKARQVLHEEFKKIDLTKPLRRQICKAINKAADVWLNEAIKSTPEGKKLKESWHVKRAN